MRFTKDEITLEEGLRKEWIITNGIGGFAASTIIGANTRKYHGLLIAPLTPPARRFLILSKLDEAVEINGKDYPIYNNLGKNYVSNATKYQTEFRKEYIPIFSYEVLGVKITKMICMQYGKNTVGVFYKIKNIDSTIKFKIAPLMNFRDFHCMSTNHDFVVKQEITGTKAKVSIDQIGSPYPIYIKASCGEYIKHDNDKYKNMFYIEEEKRGFYPEEDHTIPGIYEIELKPNEEKEIEFICSLEENIDEIHVKELISKEVIRLNELVNESLLIDNRKTEKREEVQEQNEVIKLLMQAADNFVVYRPSFGLHTLIAGYPWFLDWGRDSLIAFEGLLLITKRYDIAKEVLLTYIHDIKFGLVPNRIFRI